MKDSRLFWIAIFLLVGIKFAIGEGDDSRQSREALRLSAYAPPVIPHDIEDTPCLDCHSQNDMDIPVIPHREISNCRQCHIPQSYVPLFRKNRFRDVSEPVVLTRLYKEAPPLIPHRVFMRENCLACHGKTSRKDVIDTPHPERLNCRQCHIEQKDVKPFRKNTFSSN